MNQKYDEIAKRLGDKKVRKDVILADYTTFKIGGPADLFYEAETEEELIRVIRIVRDVGIPYFILGGGSNILVGDKGFRGMIIKVQSSKACPEPVEGFKVQSCDGNIRVLVEAGFGLGTLLNECVKYSLTGLEFMTGIPGTVGGAIKGNAGAWQKSIGDFIMQVKVLSQDGQTSWIGKEDCQFGYRESRFKHSSEIILAAEFKMDKGDKKEIEEKVNEFLARRATQPKEPSAGCVFVNPKPLSAGELVEQCSLKGTQIGGAKISEKHANFIVGTGGAKAVDVAALIDLAKQKVKEKFNIDLQEEIVRVGEF